LLEGAALSYTACVAESACPEIYGRYPAQPEMWRAALSYCNRLSATHLHHLCLQQPLLGIALRPTMKLTDVLGASLVLRVVTIEALLGISWSPKHDFKGMNVLKVKCCGCRAVQRSKPSWRSKG